MAALLTSVKRRQGQVGGLPDRVPQDGHQGAAARRQRLRLRLHPARHRHPVRPVGGPQRRRQRRRLGHRHAPTERAVHRLLRLPRQGRRIRLQQAGRRVADQGGRVRLARPHPQGPRPDPRAGRRRGRRHQARRGARAVRPVRRPRRRRRRGDGAAQRDPDGEWDKTDLLAHEREMLGLYVSDHPLHGVERMLAQFTDRTIAARAHGRPRRRHGRHRRRPRHRGAAQDHQAGVGLGDRHPRGPRGLRRHHGVPADLQRRRARCWSTTP